MISQFSGEFEFLSNFFPFPPIRHNGIVFPTVENAFQAAKSDNDFWRQVLAKMTPGEAKRAGRVVKLREDWEKITGVGLPVKAQVMAGLLEQKFSHPVMRRLLLSTLDHALVEGNTWHDTYWGRCNCHTHMGQGTNMLGQLLMSLRERI